MLPPNSSDLQIETLGTPKYNSNLGLPEDGYVNESRRVIVSCDTDILSQLSEVSSFEKAGPRQKLFFNPAETRAGIVTCGGLCPGLNDVIRSITYSMLRTYGVRQVLGFRYGYKGLSRLRLSPIDLTEEVVDGIRGTAGTFLGSSRGPQPADEMLDVLKQHKINILFAVGGDGTLRGAADLARRAKERQENISVIGVPKTIDNDICWTQMSFGFFTAIEVAKEVVLAAYAEARGAENGIAIVKLMGRDSGFIAAHATLASASANFCLIPEQSFTLDGEKGLLAALEKRLERKGYAVIVVAEGAGQDLFPEDSADKDASGNKKLKDIGLFLKGRIEDYLKSKKMDFTLKYLDPSYSIRSAPAITVDSEFCMLLGHTAAHAAMAGKTSMAVSLWNQEFVHIPIAEMTKRRKTIDPHDERWQSVLAMTGQRF